MVRRSKSIRPITQVEIFLMIEETRRDTVLAAICFLKETYRSMVRGSKSIRPFTQVDIFLMMCECRIRSSCER